MQPGTTAPCMHASDCDSSWAHSFAGLIRIFQLLATHTVPGLHLECDTWIQGDTEKKLWSEMGPHHMAARTDTAALLRHTSVGEQIQGPRAEHEEDLGR